MTTLELVRRALDEDLGPGDVTTSACVDPTLRGTGRILAKQALVLSGTVPAALAFNELGVRATAHLPDGSRVQPGQVVMALEGPLAGILQAERVALNFLMRLSGIATHTASVVEAAQGRVRVVCTRKTTPLHRSLEKAAVRHGGGHNHRHGLYDGVLIKDNHLVAAGGVKAAVARARAVAHHLIKIEVEVETLEQLREALEAGADVVLLDNMSDAQLARAVTLAAGRALTEASGNMDAARIARIRDLGLDMISVGGLVHQARWVDLSLKLDPRPDA
ncbi:MAG: carboxylating nicotinate-nucleotide diphosphorylase [Alphaproteobacteria bacterium]|nr:carboxylating nicotinate-nucleotide diphosphorylase [Alphaproteobacteria bacterium]